AVNPVDARAQCAIGVVDRGESIVRQEQEAVIESGDSIAVRTHDIAGLIDAIRARESAGTINRGERATTQSKSMGVGTVAAVTSDDNPRLVDPRWLCGKCAGNIDLGESRRAS